MKVYRGYDKQYGIITHPDWIYVTGDLEQAKYYASRDGSIKNGGVIEYNIDDDLNFLTIDDVNQYMEEYDEEYSINDLLWYQQGLSDDLINYGDGIMFEDPKFQDHIIYILFDKKYLKNGHEVDLVNETYFKNINEILRLSGVKLNEEIVYSKTYNDGYNNGLMDVILKNPTRKELYDNHMDAARVVIDTSTGDFYFCGAGDFIHDQMIDKIGVGSNDSIFYDYHENTFYIRDEWEDEEDLEDFYNENKGWLSAYPYIQNNMPNFKLKMMDIYGPETPWD